MTDTGPHVVDAAFADRMANEGRLRADPDSADSAARRRILIRWLARVEAPSP